MEGLMPIPSKKRRHSKACTRCRKRKIRCDFQYPTCGACLNAGSTCMGFDSIHGVDKPRSIVSHLEQEVARLEIELGHVKPQTRSVSDIATRIGEAFSHHVATSILTTHGSARKLEAPISLTSKIFLSGSPVPYLSKQARDLDMGEETKERSLTPSTLSSIPRHVVDALLKNYCENYRPQYPAVDASDLCNACDRVYNNTQPSDFDIFCVHISLAISTHTLMHRDEKRATTATYGFWATAVSHLDQVGLSNPWERLQALQLLAHYAFLNPQDVDCSKCTAAAFRLCLELGLHHELPPETQVKLGTSTLNTRRRLFWNSYGVDSAVHTVRCRPFVWPRSEFTTKFPVMDSQSSPAPHFWLLRQIECEITLAMYYPSLPLDGLDLNTSFDQWFSQMHQRLNEWYQITRQSVVLGEKIEFHELLFQCQVMRLNRPSPRCPNPTGEMRKATLNSSIALIKEFSVLDRLGKLFNLWHATYYLIEAGVCIIAFVIFEIESAGQDTAYLGGEDTTILIRYIKAFPLLLSKVSRRWAGLLQHASTLEAIVSSTLEKLQQWSKGEVIGKSEACQLKQKLNQCSQFPLFTFDEQTTLGSFARTAEMAYYPTLDGSALSSPSIPLLGSHIYGGNSQSMTSDWTAPHQIYEDNSLAFPDSFGLSSADVLAWDFSGIDSEEILAALLEGGEPLVMINALDST